MSLWQVLCIVCLLSCYTQSSEEVSPPGKRIHDSKSTSTPYSMAETTEEAPCICTLEYNPVCGSDGVTYGNACALECEQRNNPDLSKAHDGECKSQCPSALEGSARCHCTEEYNPVCGSDGVTYGNFCLFCCAQRTKPGLTKAHDGACEEA